MLGFGAIGEDTLSSEYDDNTDPPIAEDGSIKVPASRVVIFSGGTRLVTFPGGTRIVEFKDG
jgi:hypothetical protein